MDNLFLYMSVTFVPLCIFPFPDMNFPESHMLMFIVFVYIGSTYIEWFIGGFYYGVGVNKLWFQFCSLCVCVCLCMWVGWIGTKVVWVVMEIRFKKFKSYKWTSITCFALTEVENGQYFLLKYVWNDELGTDVSGLCRMWVQRRRFVWESKSFETKEWRWSTCESHKDLKSSFRTNKRLKVIWNTQR